MNLKKLAKILYAFMLAFMMSPADVVSQSHCFYTNYSALSLSDSVLIIPASIHIANQRAEKVDYTLSDGMLKINDFARGDTLKVCFSYIPKTLALASSAVPDQLFDSSARFSDVPNTEHSRSKSTQELIGLGGIQISGAFMRSASAGGRQSAMIHSVMDLTISGDLSDDLKLEARMTDQQMPFEPEGNTQRLQDFDRVNIKLIHDDWGLEAGDIHARSNDNLKFLKFDRQVQGVGLSSSRLSFDSTQSSTELITSFARSKTGVQNIEPIEGVLGPYRVEGPQNEPFIFILGGSEKVFLDGRQLRRGFAEDYTIDYNAAEITFSSKHYISKYSVIQIEFEYSDRQYNRSVITFNHHQSIGSLDLSIGYFQQSDKPDTELNDLSQSDRDLLSSIVEKSQYAEIPAIDSLGFVVDRARYARKDTSVNDKPYAIYILSSDSSIAHYQLDFAMVGQNKGNYVVMAGATTNEIVYEWTAPQDGVPQGNYEPIKKFPLPQNQRVVNIGLKYKLKDHSAIHFQYAGSDLVNNRFNRQATQQKGNAVSLGYESAPKPLSFGDGINIKYYLVYEYLDSTFSPIQPFKQSNFNRNWGINETAVFQAGEEHLINLGATVKNSSQSLNYHMALRSKETVGEGVQHSLSFDSEGIVRVKFDGFLMQSEHREMKTNWKKALVDVRYPLYTLVPGYSYEIQQHEIHKGKTLLESFQYFDSHKFYLTREDSLRWNFTLSQEFRSDNTPVSGRMVNNEEAQITQLKSSFDYGANSTLELHILRRDIRQKRVANESQKFFQGGLNWRSSLWKDHIVQNATYKTGTGRVLQRSYFFIEVGRGLGTHSWSDLNGNGQQDINEFFEDGTEYGDRNFVKVLTMGDEYQTAFISNLQYQLSWTMPRAWINSKSVLDYVGRLSGNFKANLDSKNTFTDWVDRISPFNLTLSENILSSRDLWKSTLYFNRGGVVFFESAWSQSNRKQLLLEGYEGLDRREYSFSGTWRIVHDWNLSSYYRTSNNSSFSDRVEGRDYQFSSKAIVPKLIWQSGTNSRFTFACKKENKWSPDEGIGGKVKVSSVDLSGKLMHLQNGIIESKVSYVQVVSDLIDNQSPLAYEMFEGLRAGDNYIWNVSLRRKIIGDLTLMVQYMGRKSPAEKTLHNGSIQVAAVF